MTADDFKDIPQYDFFITLQSSDKRNKMVKTYSAIKKQQRLNQALQRPYVALGCSLVYYNLEARFLVNHVTSKNHATLWSDQEVVQVTDADKAAKTCLELGNRILGF